MEKEANLRAFFVFSYLCAARTQNDLELIDELGGSLLPNFNAGYVVDATRKGNETRVTNHLINSKCYQIFLPRNALQH